MSVKLALAGVVLVFLCHFRLSGTMYGQPVSVPALLLVFLALFGVTLFATAVVVRKLVREVMASRKVWLEW